MASTLPTCQLRDSSSRRHLGYSGVLFTMQHSVQHKKIARASVRNLIHCAWLVGSMAAYWKEMYGFHLAFPRNRPKWSLRWRVGANENEWLHVAKKQNIYIECIERHADTTSVIGAAVTGNLLQMKWKTPTWENCEHSLIEIKSSWNISVQENGTMKMTHWDEPWTIHNSAVLRLKRALMCPFPNRPRYRHVCEWTHCVRMSGLDEEPGSSPPTKCSQRAKSSPRGDQAKSPAAQDACASMDGWVVCLAACVTGEYARMVTTHAKRRKLIQEKNNKKDSLN